MGALGEEQEARAALGAKMEAWARQGEQWREEVDTAVAGLARQVLALHIARPPPLHTQRIPQSLFTSAFLLIVLCMHAFHPFLCTTYSRAPFTSCPVLLILR